MASPIPIAVSVRRHVKNLNSERSAKNTSLGNKFSKSSNVSSATLSKDVQRSAFASLTKIKPRLENKGSTSTSVVTKKKRSPKIYEPIRLPEDILTIQAHSASTPVTELPYLLIAAHIGALPTTRQFYPTTSSTNSPLTVFRDMFVMTIDVRGYKPSSVRLSTEGHLVIIECLQSEVPQVVFTQTGTVDDNDQCVVDATPNLNEMPVHTSFNYVQHRIKLPEDFSEEGLKVGLDDVSGHVIITGRLVHNLKTDFPEAWNKNRVVRKSRGHIINTASNVNLNQEDARKLAAWNAVQGKTQGSSGTSAAKHDELITPNLIGYGRKQWLEREGAKLRSIQHKALRENIRKLTQLKHRISQKQSAVNSDYSQIMTSADKHVHKHQNRGGAELDTESATDIKNTTRAALLLGEAVSNFSLETRTKDSRHKVSFPPDLKAPLSKKKKKHRSSNDGNESRSSLMNKSLYKLDPALPLKPKGKKKIKKVHKIDYYEENRFHLNNPHDQEGTLGTDISIIENGISKTEKNINNTKEASCIETAEAEPTLTEFHSHDLSRKHNSENNQDITSGVGSSEVPSGSTTPKTSGRRNIKPGCNNESPGSVESQFKSVTPSKASSLTKIREQENKQIRPLSAGETRNVSKISSRTDVCQIEFDDLREMINRSSADTDKNIDDTDDPIGKQDKEMWEALLGHAGVGHKSSNQNPKTYRDIN